jgi:hypothetical protein
MLILFSNQASLFQPSTFCVGPLSLSAFLLLSLIKNTLVVLKIVSGGKCVIDVYMIARLWAPCLMAPFSTFIICLFIIIYSFFHWALKGQTRIYKGETSRVHSHTSWSLPSWHFQVFSSLNHDFRDDDGTRIETPSRCALVWISTDQVRLLPTTPIKSVFGHFFTVSFSPKIEGRLGNASWLCSVVGVLITWCTHVILFSIHFFFYFFFAITLRTKQRIGGILYIGWIRTDSGMTGRFSGSIVWMRRTHR